MNTYPGWELIKAERQRQIEKEGWTADHDSQHLPRELAEAANAYRLAPGPDVACPEGWPWEDHWWKPKDRLRNLVRAGALYLAASDRAVSMGGHVAAKEYRDMAVRCNHLMVAENLV